jgi:two-component system, NarL family, response regulator DevR
MAKIRVLLVDDHDIVRLGLMTLINDRADMQVVGEAGDATEAVVQVEKLRPDVVLMDIRLPGASGIDATRKIAARFPDTKVVMLTSFADDDLVVHAVAAGAVGYVLKRVGNDELLRAVAAAGRGEALLDPATTAKLLSRVREAERKSEKDAFRDLSPREMDVLALIARARTNGEIGQALGLTEKTVGNYVSTILEKLHFTNRIELATYAVEYHIHEYMSKD